MIGCFMPKCSWGVVVDFSLQVFYEPSLDNCDLLPKNHLLFLLQLLTFSTDNSAGRVLFPSNPWKYESPHIVHITTRYSTVCFLWLEHIVNGVHSITVATQESVAHRVRSILQFELDPDFVFWTLRSPDLHLWDVYPNKKTAYKALKYLNAPGTFFREFSSSASLPIGHILCGLSSTRQASVIKT